MISEEEEKGNNTDIAPANRGFLLDAVTKFITGDSQDQEVANQDDQQNDNEQDEEEKKKKKGGGPCGAASNSGDQAAEYPPGTAPDELGEISMGSGGSGGSGGGSGPVDDSTNEMCKKVYTIFRAIPK